MYVFFSCPEGNEGFFFLFLERSAVETSRKLGGHEDHGGHHLMLASGTTARVAVTRAAGAVAGIHDEWGFLGAVGFFLF